MSVLGDSDKVMRSIRVPSFLDKEIIEHIEKLPKVTNTSQAYIYFVSLGVRAFDHHSQISSDPEESAKAKKQLDSIFQQREMVSHLKELGRTDPSKLKAIALAVEFAQMENGKFD